MPWRLQPANVIAFIITTRTNPGHWSQPARQGLFVRGAVQRLGYSRLALDEVGGRSSQIAFHARAPAAFRIVGSRRRHRLLKPSPRCWRRKRRLHLLAALPQRPFWLSLTCRDARHLADGSPLKEILQAARDVPNLCAIGVNCVGPRLLPRVITTLRDRPALPVLAEP